MHQVLFLNAFGAELPASIGPVGRASRASRRAGCWHRWQRSSRRAGWLWPSRRAPWQPASRLRCRRQRQHQHQNQQRQRRHHRPRLVHAGQLAFARGVPSRPSAAWPLTHDLRGDGSRGGRVRERRLRHAVAPAVVLLGFRARAAADARRQGRPRARERLVMRCASSARGQGSPSLTVAVPSFECKELKAERTRACLLVVLPGWALIRRGGRNGLPPAPWTSPRGPPASLCCKMRGRVRVGANIARTRYTNCTRQLSHRSTSSESFRPRPPTSRSYLHTAVVWGWAGALEGR